MKKTNSLVSGGALGSVVDRHRSREFIDFLRMLDAHYAPGLRIQVILDNHSAHTSKETRAYLETIQNRFEFVFTPKHGSWFNIIESFFSKMSQKRERDYARISVCRLRIMRREDSVGV